MPALFRHRNYGCLPRSHSRKWGFRHLIRQQLQNRLSPHIVLLILCGQQPAIMVKILPMNELLHMDLPGSALAYCRLPHTHKRQGPIRSGAPSVKVHWFKTRHSRQFRPPAGSGRQPFPIKARRCFARPARSPSHRIRPAGSAGWRCWCCDG